MEKQMKYRICTLFSTLFLLQPLHTNAAEPQSLTIDEMTLVARNEIIVPPTPTGSMDEALFQQDETTDLGDDLFGTLGGGYVHPFLTIAGEYTDNLFDLNENKTNNFLTSVAPGIWFALPRTKEVPIRISPNNTSAGGLQMGLDLTEGFDRINS